MAPLWDRTASAWPMDESARTSHATPAGSKQGMSTPYNPLSRVYEVGCIFLVPPKRTPGIYTHQYEKGTLYTLTKNRKINPASNIQGPTSLIPCSESRGLFPSRRLDGQGCVRLRRTDVCPGNLGKAGAGVSKKTGYPFWPSLLLGVYSIWGIQGVPLFGKYPYSKHRMSPCA